ncbi:unnamed protein product [Brassica oleracea]
MRNEWTLALLEVLNITLKLIKAIKTTYNSSFDMGHYFGCYFFFYDVSRGEQQCVRFREKILLHPSF